MIQRKIVALHPTQRSFMERSLISLEAFLVDDLQSEFDNCDVREGES